MERKWKTQSIFFSSLTNHFQYLHGKQLATILKTKYSILPEQANQITATYLSAFRKCPDNPAIPLDEWRQNLWHEALPHDYKYLSYDIYQKWLDLRYKYLALRPEIITLLQLLRQSYFLAILTNGPSAAQWEKVQRLQLAEHFDCIMVSGDMPWEKPDPRIFYAVCKYLEVKPSECAMVGDKLETDIEVWDLLRFRYVFFLLLLWNLILYIE